jgi:tetratricopeptide (TPR) repeat protein
MSSAKPLVFISYAHKDGLSKPLESGVDWLEFVLEHLRPGERAGRYSLWVDLQMMGGAKWEAEIEQRLRVCDIFILLVSRRSMSSDFILDRELPIVRQRDAKGEPIHIYPVILTPTAIVGLDNVRDRNIRPRDAQPLSGFSDHERDVQMAGVANEIEILCRSVATSRGAPPSDAGGSTAARTGQARRLLIDIGHLPETSYKSLIGREAEIARLDAAWADHGVNILSLVAEGGAGKSALVNEWLTRLRRDNYRGADAVLGWSFFSQGSEKRATSADEFLNWALDKLGVKVESTSAAAKGEAIAEALTTRRALLVLDGVEPLQHGPGLQEGQLNDQGLRALLRRFVAEPPDSSSGLIVLTSRLAVADLQRFKDVAPVIDVGRLSNEAGAALLRDNDVWGIDKELKAASREFGGHPLALTLLASLIKETQNGDVRRRDHIRGLLADADNPRHDQARRVMESYEKEWLADQPILLAILHCVGLFDRPASGECLKALRAKPAIRGLTDALVDISEDRWRRAVVRLREVRLLSPVDPSDPDALDAHPLVREWFGERLRQTNEAAWKAAHSRLYDHLRDMTREGPMPTLADLSPLFHAVAHACRAGRHQEALHEVYANRICRRRRDGKIEFYLEKKLGAVGSDLAVIAWFFNTPYSKPASALTASDGAWVLGEASRRLRARGRLQEALPAVRDSLRLAEEAQEGRNAAIRACNLSETELLVGEIAATATAEKSVTLADRTGDPSLMMLFRVTHADALHAAGEWEKAAALFADAERRQQESQPQFPFLYSVRGYQYCDLLLSRGQAAEARDRAARTLEIARSENWVRDIALDNVTLGRAHLDLAMQSAGSGPSAVPASTDARAAPERLDEAVEGLRASERSDHLPRGLLARAAFRRTVSDWDGAKRDLDEAKEIAESGLMRLYWCDCALEGARLALAQHEAFAPLNGLVEPSPPPPVLPDATAAAVLRGEARNQLEVARKLIAECGYHRRDEELAELDTVVTGHRRFADLPPRV